jgi:hypothetical protein
VAYSPEFKASALIRLAENGHDIDGTAAEVGCSPDSLRRWAAGKSLQMSATKKAEFANIAKLTVADYLEQAVKQMLDNIPATMKGNDWAVAIGILLDKWLLLNDQATERVETLHRWLEELPEDAKSTIIEEAERVLAESYGSRRDNCGIEVRY